MVATWRDTYKKNNTCSWCPKPRHYSETKNRHLSLCTKHWHMERANKKRCNDRKKALGLCHQCGKQLEHTSVRTCTPCATKYNGYKGINKTQNRITG